MLHACVRRFDVMGNLKNFAKFSGTKLSPTLWRVIAVKEKRPSDSAVYNMTILLTF
jgi:hypothetical protein